MTPCDKRPSECPQPWTGAPLSYAPGHHEITCRCIPRHRSCLVILGHRHRSYTPHVAPSWNRRRSSFGLFRSAKTPHWPSKLRFGRRTAPRRSYTVFLHCCDILSWALVSSNQCRSTGLYGAINAGREPRSSSSTRKTGATWAELWIEWLPQRVPKNGERL